MTSIFTLTAESSVVTALRKTRKAGYTLIRAPSGCGTFKACSMKGTSAMPKKCCAACAILLHYKTKTVDEIEEAVADALGVDRDWVIDFQQGWDGCSGSSNGYPDAFKLGNRLAKEFCDGA
jgi:hypothetical protein